MLRIAFSEGLETGKKFFLFSKKSKQSLGPTHSPTQKVLDTHYPGVNSRSAKLTTRLYLGFRLGMKRDVPVFL